MRKSLVAANWKMVGSEQFAENLVGKIVQDLPIGEAEVVLCPPFVYLDKVWGLMGDVESARLSLGAQDVSLHAEGAYTGQIAASMLAEKHCRYVIVGHSERRQYCGETDEMVAGKMMVAIEKGLVPIVCLGETLAQRQADDTEKVLLGQLNALLDKGGIASMQQAVLAYEPIWAIGTGQTATPEQAQAIHKRLRLELVRHNKEIADSVRILYGGSVKPDNAEMLFSKPDIDGGLIGGASLKAEDFLAIVAAAKDR